MYASKSHEITELKGEEKKFHGIDATHFSLIFDIFLTTF